MIEREGIIKGAQHNTEGAFAVVILHLVVKVGKIDVLRHHVLVKEDAPIFTQVDCHVHELNEHIGNLL